MSLTLRTSRSTTSLSHNHSGRSIWRMGNGVPLTWMRIGTPLWKAGRYLSLFDFPMERGLHPAQLSLVRTQTARTATLSRKAERMSFTERSSRKTSAQPLQLLLRFDRFTHDITRTALNLFVNAGEIFANDTEADHQKTPNDEFQ